MKKIIAALFNKILSYIRNKKNLFGKENNIDKKL